MSGPDHPPRFVDALPAGLTVACAAGAVLCAIAGVWLAAGMLAVTAALGVVLLTHRPPP